MLKVVQSQTTPTNTKEKTMSRLFKRAKAFTFASLTIGAMAIVPLLSAAPAQALPSNCTVSGIDPARSVKCLTGTGQYRIAIHCIDWHGASSNFVYGPWMISPYGLPSAAKCGWTQRVGAVWYQTLY